MVEGALLPRYYENLSSHSMEIWIQHLITDEVLQDHTNVHLDSFSIRQIKVLELEFVKRRCWKNLLITSCGLAIVFKILGFYCASTKKLSTIFVLSKK